MTLACIGAGIINGYHQGWKGHEREVQIDTMSAYVFGLEDSMTRFREKQAEMLDIKLSKEALERLQLRYDNNTLRQELAKVIDNEQP